MNTLKTIFLTTIILFTLNSTADGPVKNMVFGKVECKGESVPFLHIFISGTTIGTTTDATGNFKIINIPEGPVNCSLLNNASDCIFSYSFNGTQPKAYIPLFINRKPDIAFIYIRTKYRNSHSAAFIHELADLFNIRDVTAQDSGHELGRVVGFQVSGLIAYIGITG